MKLQKYQISLVAVLITLFFYSCENVDIEVPQPQESIDLSDFKEAETCRPCHPVHYDEWKSSMHAFAMKDPFSMPAGKVNKNTARKPASGSAFSATIPMLMYPVAKWTRL